MTFDATKETRTFNIRGKRLVGVLLSENDKTVLVRLSSRAVIKRHKVRVSGEVALGVVLPN